MGRLCRYRSWGKGIEYMGKSGQRKDNKINKRNDIIAKIKIEISKWVKSEYKEK